MRACKPGDTTRHRVAQEPDSINHPSHYGGDTTYEAIKVIEAWGLNFNLGNAAKYLARADRKGDRLQDLQKARWYIEREIELQLTKSGAGS